MKRILTFLLAMTLLFTASCGGSAGQDDGTIDNETTADTTAPEIVMQEPDADGMLHFGERLVKAQDTLDEDSVSRFSAKLTSLREKYFPENDVYYAIVPEQAWYWREQTTHYIDHDRVSGLLAEPLEGWTAVDLASCLTAEDYYATDAHWRQECLLPAVEALGEAMGFAIDGDAFTKQSAEGFIGGYRAYLSDAGSLEAETLYWLESSFTQNAVVDNFQDGAVTTVYDPSKLESESPYDFFLSGATPLTVIENPDAASDRELVIFRDSYASSLAPLLLEAYSKVTLVDLRYMVSSLLPRYVDFGDADVLFLYSTAIVNNSMLLK
ncbi:MAG: hypothetical protein IJ493_01270 [Clostridia bacterium]|nr:hypothetical protein [Clostridia bacterium]